MAKKEEPKVDDPVSSAETAPAMPIAVTLESSTNERLHIATQIMCALAGSHLQCIHNEDERSKAIAYAYATADAIIDYDKKDKE